MATIEEMIAPTSIGGTVAKSAPRGKKHPWVSGRAASSISFTVNGKTCTVWDGDKIVGTQAMLAEYFRDVLKVTGAYAVSVLVWVSVIVLAWVLVLMVGYSLGVGMGVGTSVGVNVGVGVGADGRLL